MPDTKDALDNTICPTRIIEDVPAQQDLLVFQENVGPHERVAAAIAEIIRSSEETGGTMIALEGGWGSGKTTVVNLLRKDLMTDTETTLFIFDAWAHQGDPLRRTFLESLIAHFQKFTWIAEKPWKNTVEALAKRRRVTKTNTIPKTTLLGLLFFLSLLLIPTGAPFLAAALAEGVELNRGGRISWTFVTGMVLCLLPFVVLVGNLLRLLCTRIRALLVDSRETKANNGNSDWSFITGNVTSTMTNETTETPNPTSIEFEDHFLRLMRDALLRYPKRKLVIVLDNLDRVDPEDALSIWSTLQTFLQRRLTFEDQWFKRLWIVVPYDPCGLQHLWERRIQSTNGEITVTRVSGSFIDKSFQLRFEVPPLVLSNWKKYLIQLVGQALPRHPEDDQQAVYRVLSQSGPFLTESPTPRLLKLVVNQIGVIHRQWQHEYPITDITYYVIARREHGDIRKRLLDGSLPTKTAIPLLSKNIKANLAGLAFNVNPNAGQQLLLSGPITDALTANNVNRLVELKAAHEDGFWAVLENLAESEFYNADTQRLSLSTLCLNNSKILDENRRAEVASIKNAIMRAVSARTIWIPFSGTTGEGIAAALEIASVEEVSNRVLEAVRNTLRIASSGENKGFEIDSANIHGLVTILDKLQALGHTDTLSSAFKLEVDGPAWINACQYISENSQQWWSSFEPKASPQQLSEAFSTAIVQGQFAKTEFRALEVTSHCPKPPDWASLTQSLEQRLNAAQNVPSKEMHLLLEGLSLARLSGFQKADDSLGRLAKGGHLLHHLHKANSENNVDCEARIVAEYLRLNPSAEVGQQVGNSQQGHAALLKILGTDDHDFAARFLGIMEKENDFETLFKTIKGRSQYDPLIVRCLKIVTDGDRPADVFNVEFVIEEWEKLNAELADQHSPHRFGGLLTHLARSQQLEETLIESGFAPERSVFYAMVLSASSSTRFSHWCINQLLSVDTTAWKQALFTAGPLVQLLLSVIKGNRKISLKHPFEDAMIAHATALMDGQADASALLADRIHIISGLRRSERAVLRKGLIEITMRKDGGISESFFDMYGEEIMDKKTLLESRDVVRRLFSPLVRQRNVRGLRWLNELLTQEKKLLDKVHDSDSVSDFLQRVRDGATEKREDNADNILREIAGTLGITMEQRAEPSEMQRDQTDENGK